MRHTYDPNHPGIKRAVAMMQHMDSSQARAEVTRDIIRLQEKGNGAGQTNPDGSQSSYKAGVNIDRTMQQNLHVLEVAEAFLGCSDIDHPNSIRKITNAQNGVKDGGSLTMSNLWKNILDAKEQKRDHGNDYTRNGMIGTKIGTFKLG